MGIPDTQSLSGALFFPLGLGYLLCQGSCFLCGLAWHASIVFLALKVTVFQYLDVQTTNCVGYTRGYTETNRSLSDSVLICRLSALGGIAGNSTSHASTGERACLKLGLPFWFSFETNQKAVPPQTVNPAVVATGASFLPRHEHPAECPKTMRRGISCDPFRGHPTLPINMDDGWGS